MSGKAYGGREHGGREPYNSYNGYGRYTRLRKMIAALLIPALLACVFAGVWHGAVRASYPRKYENLVRENCARFGVEESLVYAVIRTESGFDPQAKSSVGAMGLMQIMPDTFMWLQSKLPYGEGGDKLDDAELYDPEVNIRYGVYFLSMLSDEFGSDTLTAAAYHAGSGKVRQWLSSGLIERDCRYGDIPSGVTGYYVRKVEKAREMYSKLYYS